MIIADYPVEMIAKDKEKFCSLLLQTGRSGVQELIYRLEEVGFFEAPASKAMHCSYTGGLLRHSLNVYEQAILISNLQKGLYTEHPINPAVTDDSLPNESIVIASLLHDVCKADIYRPAEKFKKDESGKWVKYETYESCYDEMPLGHGEKSVIRLLEWGFHLTKDEILAIRWHMAKWDLSESYEANQCFNTASSQSPLLSIIIAADGLATRITESKF